LLDSQSVYGVLPVDIALTFAMTNSAADSQSLHRRSLLRWIGAAALILPASLSACASSTPPRQYTRPPSHITGKDHRNGKPQPNRVISIF
jgi:hypothetical protein